MRRVSIVYFKIPGPSFTKWHKRNFNAPFLKRERRLLGHFQPKLESLLPTKLRAIDRRCHVMSTNLYFDLSRVFTPKLVLEDEMAGWLTAQSKEAIASVSEDERQNGRRIQVTDVLGRAASARGVSKRSVKRARRLSRAGVYREGQDDREPQQTFYKKYHNFFIFQAIFFIHISKKLLRYNLFKNVWILRIEQVLFILRPKNQGPGILK